MSQETLRIPAAGVPSSSPGPMRDAAATVYWLGLSCALSQARAAAAGGCGLLGGAARRGCRWSRAAELALRRQVEELRRLRAEDARANEKVAGIFASHEQRWLVERRALRRQVDAVVAAARAREAQREAEAAELARQLEDLRGAAGAQDADLAREVQRREDAEERARAAERGAEEMRERAGKEAAEHAAELRKHKAALAELASAQRQLEADLARAARAADAAEAEARAALARRDEAAAAAAEVSAEAARLRRDADHKDKILSAMLRKSKVDVEDREMLVREVKVCKARRKQAELEAERWRRMCESRAHRARGSSRSSAGCSDKLLPPPHDAVARAASDAKILFVDHVEGDRDHRRAPPVELTTIECVDRYASHVDDDKPAVEEYQGLQEWFQMETEKYAAMVKHRHAAEIEAFTEQLRLKDEKLEAFRWRAVTMDVEAARLRCRVQELEARLERRAADLEALLLDTESENRALREQLDALRAATCAGGQDGDPCVARSSLKIERALSDSGRLSSGEKGGRDEVGAAELTADCRRRSETKPVDEPVSPDDYGDRVERAFDAEEATEARVFPVLDHAFRAEATEAATSTEQAQERRGAPSAARRSFRCEIEEEEVCTDPGTGGGESLMMTSITSGSSRQEATMSDHRLALVVVPAPLPDQKESASAAAWKTDIQAMSVSYKIKRLKQQLQMLENLAAQGNKEAAAATKPSAGGGSEASGGSSSSSRQSSRRTAAYQTMVSFLSKHVKRYHSLDGKIDDLCARMEESKRGAGRGAGEQMGAAAALGQLLEETFQLQRLMVATGQKLLETQSRIAPGLARSGRGGGEGDDDGVDMKRLMDVAGALLRDVQRGLEVRIARIIGDLEGTLTFHGILRGAR